MSRYDAGEYERLTEHTPEPADEAPVPATTAGGAVAVSRSILRDSGTVGLLAAALTVFMMVVVWYRFNTVEANQAAILTAMTRANINMSAFTAQHNEIEASRSILMQSQVKLLRLLCQNSAKSEFQLAKCSTE